MERSKNRLTLKTLAGLFMAVLAILALATAASASTYHVFATDVKDLAYTFVSITNLGTVDVSVTIQAYDSSGMPLGSTGAGTIAVGAQWNLTTGSGGSAYAGAPQGFMGYALITTSSDAVAFYGVAASLVGVPGFPLTFTRKALWMDIPPPTAGSAD